MNVGKDEVLHALLIRFGWVRGDYDTPKVEYWFPSGKEKESGFSTSPLLVPKDATTYDYERLIDGGLAFLSDRYGDEFTKVSGYVEETMDRSLDPLELHEETNIPSGFISWADGSRLVLGAQGILDAAARAAVQRLRRFQNTGSTIARSAMADTLMGQTRIGSYIVTAYIPSAHEFAITEAEEKPNDKAQRSIKGREISKTLTHALASLDSGIKEVMKGAGEGSLEVFDELVQDGVSFELVDAISQLSSTQESSIKISFAQKKQIIPLTGYEFVVKPDMLHVIQRAKEFLSTPPEPLTVSLVGEVVLLQNATDLPRHEIKLKPYGNNVPSTVLVHLSPEQYVEATRAHLEHRLFSVRGRLHMKTRGSEMDTPDRAHMERAHVSTMNNNDDSRVAIQNQNHLGI